MKIEEFSKRNLERCLSPKGFNHPLEAWSTSDWMVAMMGEAGEACNIVKKLNRARDGIPGNKETVGELRDMLRRELADVYIYLNLVCLSLGIDLSSAVPEKFEETSRKIGYVE